MATNYEKWQYRRNAQGNTEAQLASAYRADWATIAPHLQDLLQTEADAVTSTGIVDAAQRQIQRSAMGSDESMNARQQMRANTNLTPSQRLSLSSSVSQAAAANNTANMHTARINQHESNLSALNRLIATTNAMKQGSASTLNEIASNESMRKQANDTARAQKRQQNTQTAVSAVATIATIAAAAW